jgi:hypothetical protein
VPENHRLDFLYFTRLSLSDPLETKTIMIKFERILKASTDSGDLHSRVANKDGVACSP